VTFFNDCTNLHRAGKENA